jgi:SulP family sulfate permease
MGELSNVQRLGAREWGPEFSGGLAGMLVSLPQSVALGVVAFAPLGGDYVSLGLVAGLFGGIIVTACSALFGGAPALISGPRASVSLVFAAILTSLLSLEVFATPGVDSRAAALSLAMIALMAAGGLQIAFGLCRFGEAIKFVPYPVIAGFLNAAAVLIILGQLRVVFDLPAEAAVSELWRYADADSFARAALMALTIAAVFVAQKYLPKIPALLAGGIFGAGVYYAVLGAGLMTELGGALPPLHNITFDPAPLRDLYGLLVGAGDNGIAFHLAVLADIDAQTLTVLLAILVPGVLSIALLQSFDTLFSAAALDDLNLSRTNSRRELIAQGCGTALGGAFGFLGGSGSMVRSMPCHLAGGRTGWSGLVSSGLLLLILLFAAPLVARVPEIIVAGILFAVAIELFDKWTIARLRALRPSGFRQQRAILMDLLIVAIVIGTAVIFGLVEAVAIGMLVAMGEFVLGAGRSPIRRNYRGDAVSSFRGRDAVSAALLSRHGAIIGVLELEGPFFFGSAGKIETEVDRLAERGAAYVILDFRRVVEIDSTASRTLTGIYLRLAKQNKELFLGHLDRHAPTNSAAANDSAQPYLGSHERWLKLKQFGAMEIIPAHNVFADTDSAMRQCEMLLFDRVGALDEAITQSREPSRNFLGSLSADDAKAIRSFAHRCEFDTGETVFAQGDTGDSFYFLLTGKVDVLIHNSADGRRIRVSTLTDGDVFGEMAILDPQPRSATIVTIERTTCYRINGRELEVLNEKHPDIGLRLMKYMCLLFTTRLRMANQAILELER